MTGLIPMALLRVMALLAVWMFMVSAGLAATPAQVTYLWRRSSAREGTLFYCRRCI